MSNWIRFAFPAEVLVTGRNKEDALRRLHAALNEDTNQVLCVNSGDLALFVDKDTHRVECDASTDPTYPFVYPSPEAAGISTR